MVTRNYDSHSIDMIKEVDEEFRADKRLKFPIRAHCRQIIPEPEERVKFGNTSNAGLWTILSNFGEPNLADEIMNRGAYHLSNVLTLETKFHDAFMRLELTFKKTDPSVRRRVCQIRILNLPTNPLTPCIRIQTTTATQPPYHETSNKPSHYEEFHTQSKFVSQTIPQTHSNYPFQILDTSEYTQCAQKSLNYRERPGFLTKHVVTSRPLLP